MKLRDLQESNNSKSRPIKVVLDTNVLISFLLTPSRAISKIIYLWDEGSIEVYYSKQTLKELELALNYTKFRGLIHKEEKESLLNKIKLLGILISPRDKVSISRDIKDNKFIEIAIAAEASYLITGDKDLLELRGFKNVRIINPKDFIAEVGKF